MVYLFSVFYSAEEKAMLQCMGLTADDVEKDSTAAAAVLDFMEAGATAGPPPQPALSSASPAAAPLPAPSTSSSNLSVPTSKRPPPRPQSAKPNFSAMMGTAQPRWV